VYLPDDQLSLHALGSINGLAGLGADSLNYLLGVTDQRLWNYQTEFPGGFQLIAIWNKVEMNHYRSAGFPRFNILPV
jgi:hypothetical protein